jgi:tRNA A-37 threonylcarbamoyl transferase component Bud32
MSRLALRFDPAILDPDKLYLAEGFSREDFCRALTGTTAAPAKPVKENPSRVVWRLQLNGRTVYVKHYRDWSLAGRLARALGYSRARREWEFAGYLRSRGVPTPTVLAWCRQDAQEWLITEAVEPAQAADQWHLEQIWRDDPPARRQVSRVAAAMGELVGRMHAAGILHGDLHCGNVLVRTDGPQPNLVLLDLHRMRRRGRLSRRQRTANLAQLYYDRFNFTCVVDRVRFLKHYLRASVAGGTTAGWAAMIEGFARRHARRQLAQRDRRIFSRNRYFAPLRLQHGWRGHVVLESKRRLAGSTAANLRFEPSDWAAALARPEELLEGPNVEVIKDSRSSLVVRRHLKIGPHEVEVYIKRSRRKHAWKVLADCLRPSRARRAFERGHVLLTRRIATALPLAALERRWGPLLRDNILITEAVHAPRLHRFLEAHLGPSPRGDAQLTASQQHHLAQQVLGQLGKLVRRLHDNRVAHRDLKAGNLLVQWVPHRTPELVLVDLDGLRRVVWLTNRRRLQGLMRLNVSLLECPAVSHAGRLRMLLGYLRRPGVQQPNFKPYWRVLEAWSARKLRQQIHSRRARQRAARRPGP